MTRLPRLFGAAMMIATLAACASPRTDAGRQPPTAQPPATPQSTAPQSTAPQSTAPQGSGAQSTGAGPHTGGTAGAASCAEARAWTTKPQHAGTPGSPAAVYNVRVGQHPAECFDRINVDLNGPDKVGYFADYVTRAQVVAEGAGTPLSVPGNAFLRVVVVAPILGRDGQGHQPWRSPPTPGLHLLDPALVRGWSTVAGVVYAGGHPNETTVYIGLQDKLAFDVDASWVNPQTQTRVVSIDIRRP